MNNEESLPVDCELETFIENFDVIEGCSFVSDYNKRLSYFTGKISDYMDYIHGNKEKIYESKKNNESSFLNFNGVFYFIHKLFYIFNNGHKFDISKEDILSLKKEFYSAKNKVNYFRLSYSKYESLRDGDKRAINNTFIFKTKKHYYFLLSDYIHKSLMHRLKDDFLIAKITNFRFAGLKREAGFPDVVFIRDKDQKKPYQQIKDSVKETIMENKKVKFKESVKLIESKINEMINFKINISNNVDSVVIMDCKNNNLLKFKIDVVNSIDFCVGGMCDFANKKITVVRSISVIDMLYVLFHEIGHMYDYFINFKSDRNCNILKCKRSDFSDIKNEVVSVLFEKIVFRFLIDKHNIWDGDIDIKYRKIADFIFNLQNNLGKNIIKTNSFLEEMFFYKYYIFRKNHKYSSAEIKNKVDMYSYGQMESEKLLKNIYLKN